MIAEREKVLRLKQKVKPSVGMRFENVDPINAYDALRLLDIAVPDTRWDDDECARTRLVLNRWGVQEALNRRGLRRLRPQDISTIEQMTLEPDLLAWPKRFKS